MILMQLLRRDLMVTEDFLLNLAASASYSYKTFQIAKRSGGTRDVHHPSRPLKAVQRWIAKEIVGRFPVHDAAYAYRRRRGTAANAALHAKSRFLLRMDFQEFFESITAADIKVLLESQRGVLPEQWKADDDLWFCMFVCRDERLTIGAPSSPSLANAICYRLDCDIQTLCGDSVRYSRYADDLFFSANTPGLLKTIEKTIPSVLKRATLPKSIELRPEKTRHSSKKRQRKVTGLVLTSEGSVSLGRETKRRLSAQVHQLDSLSVVERHKLAGWLAYAQSVEPNFINRLYIKYGATLVDRAFSAG